MFQGYTPKTSADLTSGGTFQSRSIVVSSKFLVLPRNERNENRVPLYPFEQGTDDDGFCVAGEPLFVPAHSAISRQCFSVLNGQCHTQKTMDRFRVFFFKTIEFLVFRFITDHASRLLPRNLQDMLRNENQMRNKFLTNAAARSIFCFSSVVKYIGNAAFSAVDVSALKTDGVQIAVIHSGAHSVKKTTKGKVRVLDDLFLYAPPVNSPKEGVFTTPDHRMRKSCEIVTGDQFVDDLLDFLSDQVIDGIFQDNEAREYCKGYILANAKTSFPFMYYGKCLTPPPSPGKDMFVYH